MIRRSGQQVPDSECSVRAVLCAEGMVLAEAGRRIELLQGIAAGCAGKDAAQEKHNLDPSRAGMNHESSGIRETAAP